RSIGAKTMSSGQKKAWPTPRSKPREGRADPCLAVLYVPQRRCDHGSECCSSLRAVKCSRFSTFSRDATANRRPSLQCGLSRQRRDLWQSSWTPGRLALVGLRTRWVLGPGQARELGGQWREGWVRKAVESSSLIASIPVRPGH